MLAYDANRPALIDGAKKLPGTEVAIGDPQITRAHSGESRAKQGALLRMAIFTQQDIIHQAVRRRIDHQGFSRQGASLYPVQGVESAFTRFETVAINNFHIPSNYVVQRVTAQRKPPEVRSCRLRNQSRVGTVPPSTSTPHWPACCARR